jgi:hypothetical protein
VTRVPIRNGTVVSATGSIAAAVLVAGERFSD